MRVITNYLSSNGQPLYIGDIVKSWAEEDLKREYKGRLYEVVETLKGQIRLKRMDKETDFLYPLNLPNQNEDKRKTNWVIVND